MSLAAGCPRCPALVTESGGAWRCSDHGPIDPLWRPRAASYDCFGEHLGLAGSFPTYLPWPLRPGWHVTDFGVVSGQARRTAATVTAVSGVSSLDGPVELLIVSEEPGTGLGARCAGTVHSDPGMEIAATGPSLRVRLDSQSVAMWAVSIAETTMAVDRTVVAGEAHGRWLWLIVRPASAILLLADGWMLSDVSGLGAPLLEVPFGGPVTAW